MPAAVGWLLIGIHYLIFSQFFPNAQGKLGHDYQYNLPLLLDGYYWFLNNGFFSLPWFTPSFCGGMPLMANPATFYVSTTQWFAFLVDPLTSVRLTFFLFAALGFWGFYFLLRRVFAACDWTALLGGGLFLFNGLYAWRMVVGHMEFHAFMLTPGIAFLLLQHEPEQSRGALWCSARNGVLAALMLSYAFMSGMTQLLVPSLIAVMVIAGLARLIMGASVDFVGFTLRLVGAGLGAIGLSASKLAASLSFLGNFPRDSYLLPGVEGLGKLIGLVVQVLTVGGAHVNAEAVVSNSQWLLGRHEFEFGLTVVPFVLIALGLALNGGSRRVIIVFSGRRQLPFLVLCLILLSLPLALNYYSPSWNQLLKAVPFIKSLSNFIRWLIIYIPCVVILAALAVARTPILTRFAPYVVGVSLVLVVAQNLTANTAYYHDQPYDPEPVVSAWRQTRAHGYPPVIVRQVASVDEAGQPALTRSRNDALIHGESQLLCYEPMFGFRLEFLPFKSIRPGPTLSEHNGEINLKNPACYLYPVENRCLPGDHFRVDQQVEAQRFVSFHPFRYQVSRWQALADRINFLSLLVVLIFAMVYCLVELRGWRLHREGR